MPTAGVSLTPAAAARFGHKLELCRSVTRLSLREVAGAAGVSAQYLHNIEKGMRLSPSPRVLARMSSAYMLPPNAMADLLFEARIMTALESRGIPEPMRSEFFPRCQAEFAEAGYPIMTDVAEIIRLILSR